MGQDRVRYLVYSYGRWRAAGFRLINLGPGLIMDGKHVPSGDDKSHSMRLNEEWDRHRCGLPAQAKQGHAFPPGSIGDGYHRAMRLRDQERKAKGSSGPTSRKAQTTGRAPGAGSSPCSAIATQRRSRPSN